MTTPLDLAYSDIMSEISQFLGYGVDYTTLDTKPLAVCTSVLQSGLRQFYYPQITRTEQGMGSTMTHRWNFLEALFSASLADTEATAALPVDFKAFKDQYIYIYDTAEISVQIPIVPFSTIIQYRRQNPTRTGKPQFAAISYTNTGQAAQSTKLELYPTANAAFTLKGTFTIQPIKMTAVYPYHYGGAQHSETVLESCLAVAESRMNDTIGVHKAEFEQRLYASIQADNELAPSLIGDTNVPQRWMRRHHDHSSRGEVNYPGVT
jgi:hypothetical protein